MSSASASDSVVVYDGAVSRADAEVRESELEGLRERVSPLFSRMEPKNHAKQYLRGLLSSLERKNGWTIAEHAGKPEPKALQRFLNLSRGTRRSCSILTVIMRWSIWRLPVAFWLRIRPVFRRRARSAGVQRQYTGKLYLPQSWIDDQGPLPGRGHRQGRPLRHQTASGHRHAGPRARRGSAARVGDRGRSTGRTRASGTG